MLAESISPGPTIDRKSKGNHAMKNALKIIGAVVIVLISFAGVVLAYLVYPGTPSQSKFMTFDGFIELPRSRLLNVLDYLTLNGSTLFVTSESSGALFKIDLDLNQPSVSSVSEMPGTGAAHGVALLPEANVAFITRSEENTVDVFDPKSLQKLGSIPVADDGEARLATLIDPVRRAIVGAIQFSGKPEFPALDPQTGLLYQNLQDINSIAAIDLGKRSVVGQWSLAPCEGPSGMAIDSEQRRLFTVCSANASLVVFDLETHRVITL